MKKVLLLLTVLLCAVTASAFSVQGHQMSPVLRAGDSDTQAPADELHSLAGLGTITYAGSSSGTNTAYLILQWNTEGEEESLVFGYRYSGTKTGYDMILDVAKKFPQLYYLTHETDMGNTIAGMGWDVDADRNIALDNGGDVPSFPDAYGRFYTDNYGYDSWNALDTDDLWQAGWTQRGYWSFWNKASIEGDFVYSQKGASNQVLTNGCVHAWMFKPLNAPASAWKPARAPKVTKGSFTVDDIKYNILDTPEPKVNVAFYQRVSGDIVIPDYVSDGSTNYRVVGLDQQAFAWNSNITSISIGNVDYIDYCAIAGLANLTSVTVKGNVNYLGDQAIQGNKKLVSVSFPEGWTCVNPGTLTFDKDVLLTEIPFPANQTFIPKNYFSGTDLRRFDIPEGVVSIDESAFSDCSNMTSVSLPSTLKRIEYGAFSNTAIEDFDIPASVTMLGQHSLSTPSLKHVRVHTQTPIAIDNYLVFPLNMPEGADLTVPGDAVAAYQSAYEWRRFGSNIKEEPFITVNPGTVFTDAASGLRFVTVSSSPLRAELTVSSGDIPAAYWSGKVCSYTAENYPSVTGYKALRIPSKATLSRGGISLEVEVVGIGAYALSNFDAGGSSLVLIDENGNECNHIKYIKEYGFAGAKVDELWLPRSIETIGEGAFSKSSTLSRIWQTNGGADSRVTDIPASMCASSPKIYAVDFLNSKIRTVGEQAFSGCSKLGVYDSNLAFVSVGAQAFRGCSTLDMVLPSTLKEIGDNAFQSARMSENTEVVIPSDLVLGKNVFSGASNIVKATIKEGVEIIPEGTFASVRTLASAVLPSSVNTIGNEAFKNTALSEVIFPEGLQTLGTGAFAGTKVSTVTFPAAIVNIPDGVFENCLNLTEVNFAPGTKTIGKSSFSTTGMTRVEIPASVTSLHPWSFYYSSYINEVIIPEDTQLTEMTGFSFCPALKTIHIPANIKAIGQMAFQQCSGLESVTGMEGVTGINESAFAFCSSLKSFTVPESCTALGKHAFFRCYALETINLPAAGIALGEEALRECTGLKEVFLPDGTTFDWEVFAGCRASTAIWYGIVRRTETLYRVTIDVLHSTPFDKNYVLQGMKSDIETWANHYFSAIEVPVALTYPEEHVVEVTGQKCIVAMSPEFDLDLTGLDLTAEQVPAAFRDADIRHFAQTLLPARMSFEYRKTGDTEWKTAEITLGTSTPEAAARDLNQAPAEVSGKSAGSYEVHLTALEPETTYEYRFNHTAGNEATADQIRTFTTGTSVETGVEDVLADAEVRVYPNPATSTVFVNNDGPVEIFDTCGRCVVNADCGREGIDISSLPSGLYIVRYINGGETGTSRLIVR